MAKPVIKVMLPTKTLNVVLKSEKRQLVRSGISLEQLGQEVCSQCKNKLLVLYYLRTPIEFAC